MREPAQFHARVTQYKQIKLQVVAALGLVCIFKQRPQRIEHFTRREMSRSFRRPHRDVVPRARLRGKRYAAEFIPQRRKAGGFGVDREDRRRLEFLHHIREL